VNDSPNGKPILKEKCSRKFLPCICKLQRQLLEQIYTESVTVTAKERDDMLTHKIKHYTFRLSFSFNQLDLPAYETYDKLYTQLLKAVQECTEGFGLA